MAQSLSPNVCLSKSLSFPPFAHTKLEFSGAIPVAPNSPRNALQQIVDGTARININQLEDASKFTVHETGRLSYMYFMTFLCVETRAVHLELISSLGIGPCSAAINSFIKKRGGPPICFFSDGDASFTGSELEDLLCQREGRPCLLEVVTARFGTKWSSIPSSAVHFGEHLENGVKHARLQLQKMLNTHIVTHDEMITIMQRLEYLLNERPLFPVTNDALDVRVITPNYLIQNMFTLTGFSPASGGYDPECTRWQYLRNMMNSWWQAWTALYLSSLQAEAKRESPKLKIGDMVLVTDATVQGTEWPIGRIIEITRGCNEEVLYAKIRTRNETRHEWRLLASLLRLARYG